jgi:hypothetical protein
MSLPASEVAQRFWAHARLPLTYPRDIEHAVALVLPLAIVKLPTLTTGEVTDWLASHDVVVQVNSEPLSLMGCLVANRGHGIVFACGGDSPEEQRLTVAHEAAHFLRHYLMPREQVLRALGGAIAPVLDGEREATPEERIAGLLAGVRVGAHVHLLPRLAGDDSRIATAEDEADDLGLELVAPRDAVLAFLRTRHVERLEQVDQQRALASNFGLPAHVFARTVADHNRVRPTSFLSDALSAIRERK